MPRKEPEPVRITTAAQGHSDDIGHRQRRYLISMLIRTVCFVLAVVFMGTWLRWVFLGGSVFLPFVAVVIAYGGAAPDPGGPDPFLADPDIPRLEGPRTP